MVKIQVRRDPGAAVSYFLSDPQLSESEKRGIWLGNGCEEARMEIRALVTKSALESVLNGRGPSGDRLVQKVKENRRVAWDTVVTPHKSVSVAALCLVADVALRVREAFDAAVTELFRHMESLAHRQASRPGDPLVHTGNLMAAQFVHEASRHADPHLHAHLLIVNTTHCPDHRWRSLEPSPLYRHQTALKFVFNAHLHRELIARGFLAIRDVVDGLTKLQVPASICKLYSKAHNSIVGMASDILSAGKLDPDWCRLPTSALINRLNERTRPKIRPDKPDWSTLLSEETKAEVGRLITAAEPPETPQRPPARPKESPITVLRERWRAASVSRRPLKHVVATTAAEFPGVLMGEFARAAYVLRGEIGDAGDAGDEDRSKSTSSSMGRSPRTKAQAAALQDRAKKTVTRRKIQAASKAQRRG